MGIDKTQTGDHRGGRSLSQRKTKTMKRKDLDSTVVTASEIAAWAWCPESWRRDWLEIVRDDEGNIRHGEAFHERRVAFEKRSRSAISLGWWLIALAVLIALLAFVFAGGSDA